jgi:hypothetical protein
MRQENTTNNQEEKTPLRTAGKGRECSSVVQHFSLTFARLWVQSHHHTHKSRKQKHCGSQFSVAVTKYLG